MNGAIKISTQIVPFGSINYMQNGEEEQREAPDMYVYGGYETTSRNTHIEIRF